MRLMSKLKNLLQGGDFFHSTQLFRYGGESQYKTMTGGILSVGIIVTIIIGFSNMIINTLNLSTITYNQIVTKRQNPSAVKMIASPDQNYMFGLEIHHVDLNAPTRYFDIIGWYHVGKYGKYQNFDVPLVPCTKEHWASLPDVVKSFDSMDMRWWLCPQIGYELDIHGKYSSGSSQEYIFQINPCDNATDSLRPCAPQQEIDRLFSDNLNGLYFYYYYINTIINPDQVDYKTYYLEDNQGVVISKNGAVEASLYVTDYTIQTDYSILPFSDIQIDSGFIVEESANKNSYIVPDKSPFAFFFVGKSSRSIQYKRQVQKISTVFSFVGGLVGAIISVMFVINSYTSFSYEISVALEVFEDSLKSKIKQPQKKEQNSSSQNKKSVSFLDFIKHQMFCLLKFCRKKPQWPQVNHMVSCREQILHQLDVKTIIKRLVFLEYSLTYLFEDYQLEGLHIKKPTSAQDVRKIREKISMTCHQNSQNQDQLSSTDSAQPHVQRYTKKCSERLSKNLRTDQNLNQESQNKINHLIFRQNDNKMEFNIEKSMSGMIEQKKYKQKNRQDNLLRVEIIGEGGQICESSGTNIACNNHFQLGRRAQNIKILKRSAQKGDLISKKILEHISSDVNLVQFANEAEDESEIPVKWNNIK